MRRSQSFFLIQTLYFLPEKLSSNTANSTCSIQCSEHSQNMHNYGHRQAWARGNLPLENTKNGNFVMLYLSKLPHRDKNVVTIHRMQVKGNGIVKE